MRTIVIVGGGTAGCLMASRLSEDPENRVVLLEAGPDYRGNWPETVRDVTTLETGYEQVLVSEPGVLGYPVDVPVGRLLGGSSAVNRGLALRARPGDHERWAAHGFPQYSFEQALPHYERVESEIGLEQPAASPPQQAFLDACAAHGIAAVADHNAPDSEGAGMPHRTARDGVRRNAAMVYLDQPRANLIVRADSPVDRVILRNGAARGVRLAGGSEVEADEVILSAGAYNSPAILLRSGIGNALPEIGRNLRDHLRTQMFFDVAPPPPGSLRRAAVLTARSTPEQPDIDLHIHAAGHVPQRDGHAYMFVVCLVQADAVGELRLRSGDPLDPPVLDLNMTGAPGDAERLQAGTDLVRAICRQEPLASMVGDERLVTPLNTYFHPTGTCSMGEVVDEAGRVHGVAGLRVIDASIIPISPRCTTNLPTFMLADRALELAAAGLPA